MIGHKTKSNKGLKTGSVRMCKACGRDYEPEKYDHDTYFVIDYTCPHCGNDNRQRGLRRMIRKTALKGIK
jgi:predicted RNA-binding Zn-ribbon protein involved in translation (DUF1610 family)